METLLDCKGKNFECKIDGTICQGKIQVEGNEVYLCQDKRDGVNCSDKLGYNYSWIVGDGSKFILKSNDVTEFKFIDDIVILTEESAISLLKSLGYVVFKNTEQVEPKSVVDIPFKCLYLSDSCPFVDTMTATLNKNCNECENNPNK